MKSVSLAILLAIALPAYSQDAGHTIDKETSAGLFPKKPYSPHAGRNFPTRSFFGDTHLHTSFSMDGGAVGARLGPVVAYRSAKGQEVTASSGQHAQERAYTSPIWYTP